MVHETNDPFKHLILVEEMEENAKDRSARLVKGIDDRWHVGLPWSAVLDLVSLLREPVLGPLPERCTLWFHIIHDKHLLESKGRNAFLSHPPHLGSRTPSPVLAHSPSLEAPPETHPYGHHKKEDSSRQEQDRQDRQPDRVIGPVIVLLRAGVPHLVGDVQVNPELVLPDV